MPSTVLQATRSSCCSEDLLAWRPKTGPGGSTLSLGCVQTCSRCDRPYVAGDKVSVLVPCEHVLHTACCSRQFDFPTASHGSLTELVLRWPEEVRDEIKDRISEGHACPICQNKCVLGHPVVVFACKHFIHPNCYWSLVEGTNGRPRCPLDRSEIYSTAYIVTAAVSLFENCLLKFIFI